MLILLLGCTSEQALPEGVGDLLAPSGARFFDESIPETQMDVDWFASGETGELVERSEVIFIGRIVDSSQNAYTDAPDGEDPSQLVTEFDGITFAVSEVLKGDADELGLLVVAHPAVIRGLGPELMRLEIRPIGMVRGSLESLPDPNRQNPPYLVFANPIVGAEPLLSFSTEFGVSRIDPNGESRRLRETRRCIAIECRAGDPLN